jgi:methylmalonyl-CoA/ethylmalonyl-CoA epimerase
MLGRDLAYVALVVRDVAAPTTVFEKHLGLKRTDLDDGNDGKVATFAAGKSAIAIFPVGHPYVGADAKLGVHHIALGSPNLAKGLSMAGDAGVKAVNGTPVAGLGGRKRVELEAAPLCGIRTWLIEPLDTVAATSSAIERIDHLGIASADNRAAVAMWTGKLGCELESEQTDMETIIAVESFTSNKHGVVYHTRKPVPVGGLRVSFITVGDTELEFLQNFDPRHPALVDHSSSGTTKQDQGAITKFIASRGAGLHHLAFKTPDINRVLADLDRGGVPVIDKVGRPGSRAGLIGFVNPSGMGGVLVHFDERP